MDAILFIYNKQMIPLVFQNELATAAILSLIVTVLVWVNLPKQDPSSQKQNNITKSLVKTFIIAFATCFAIIYFFSGTSTKDDVMTHMLKGEPDF
jgi:hypothetical protein